MYFGTAEYIDRISAEEKDFPNECLGYDTKQYDGEASVMLELWEIGGPLYCHRSQVHSGPKWYHLIGSYLWIKQN